MLKIAEAPALPCSTAFSLFIDHNSGAFTLAYDFVNPTQQFHKTCVSERSEDFSACKMGRFLSTLNPSSPPHEEKVDDEDDDSLGESVRQSDAPEDRDAPEVLVRRENRIIGVVRVIVLLLLISVAAAISTFIYSYTADAEVDAFMTACDGVGDRLVDALLEDTTLKFWMAKTLSSAVTLAMQSAGSSNANLTIPPMLWESMTQSARFSSNVVLVAWNPLLMSDEDRATFEAHAQSQEQKIGANAPCYMCGGPDKGYLNPQDIVALPEFGRFTCENIEVSGRHGVVPDSACSGLTLLANQICNCGDLSPSAILANNAVVIPNHIWGVVNESAVDEPRDGGPYQPIWQIGARDIVRPPIMYDELSNPIRARAINNVLKANVPGMSETFIRQGFYFEEYGSYLGDTSTLLYYPVYGPTKQIAGMVSFDLLWTEYLVGVFPPHSHLMDVVIENSCGQNFSYVVNHELDKLTLVGEGDFHEKAYDQSAYSTSFEAFEEVVSAVSLYAHLPDELEYCRYRFHAFSTARFEKQYITNSPMIYSLGAAIIFVFTSLVFTLYDFIVRQRQAKVMASATRTNNIVASLFPHNVRGRLFVRSEEAKDEKLRKTAFNSRLSEMQMQSFIKGKKESILGGEPIADLFPRATVVFIDIAGFTAWSSEREPSQVFRLLETVYQAFDEAAEALGVFKVETIGDSYVAVCGLPEPCENHAMVIVQFAKHCLRLMTHLVQELEVYLGPSTSDLKARVGIHSGPVTAGVLRGAKARFQLFGDTVNTASRLESTGIPNRIHVSKATVDLLVKAGKEDWVQPRREKVTMKGKGELQTYWVVPRISRASSTGSTSHSVDDDDQASICSSSDSQELSQDAERTSRLIDWNVEVLYGLLERVVASRNTTANMNDSAVPVKDFEKTLKEQSHAMIVIDEMTPILSMPSYDPESFQGPHKGEISSAVKEQLHAFVLQISNLYRTVPFHNFSHVSHVIMSAGKLLKRIVNPDGVDYKQDDASVLRDIHTSTYGISSDPLMHFAVVFSALIHDVDHTGLTNQELVNMKTAAATLYRNKSVAEQNSVDLAWAVLMDPQFRELQSCIYTNIHEFTRFRKLIVNAVMATDIADKELKALRESRWGDAFSVRGSAVDSANAKLDVNRKATIVFEYIIQASDICHTMQHWHTYQKFNRRLFEERYLAWLNGHLDTDPSLGWYGGELWFYDNYIIPLAEKLNACGVFGVSYDEYVNYAKENRKEWERKGKEIVETMLAEVQEQYADRLAVRFSRFDI